MVTAQPGNAEAERNEAIGDAVAANGLPLFILSLGQRDELSLLASQAGWKPIAARRPERAESRYLGSLSRIALVDLRHLDEAESYKLVSALAAAVEASGGAILALVDDEGVHRLPTLIAAGVTHFIEAPVNLARLSAALLSADKLAERVAGNISAGRDRHAVQRGDALFWRWSGAERIIWISPALDRLLESMAPGVDYRRWTLTGFIRALPRADRAGAVAAVRQAVDELMPAAFAHGVPGEPDRRLVQHLFPDAEGFSGEVEELDSARHADLRDRDFLTGLSSRQGAIRWLEQASHAPVLILLALAGFDRVNSAYGRITGDAMLSRVAMRLHHLVEQSVGGDAVVARLAGAEFLVALAPDLPNRQALVERAGLLAGQLLAEVDRPFNAGDHLIRLTGRCGIALANADDPPELMLRRAGTALADARRGSANGSIRIRYADDATARLDPDRLDADLRHALDKGEIQIVFQPQYAMSDDRIIGVEALARWHHAQFGEIGAGALFAVAERSDFVLPLSAHIHATALAEAARWPEALSGLRIAINVTAADLGQSDFLEQFLATVDSSGIGRGRVTVELTESGLVENLEAAAAMLGALQQAGLKVAIDDFGTGYSSLAYLKALPLDYLKIDAQIARDILGSSRDRIVVRAIVDMARSLGLSVIAEGVESERQLALLARAGCDTYQGFLRSPAVASEALVALVAEAPRLNPQLSPIPDSV
jgi:EAL domain-containing protein (putative c-di-GMP-specific phosphodiesterase class I)/GGDEF domain-containing protein